jgi:hypothetical protein
MPDEFDHIDWSLTTWEGSRREQLRRWSELSLDEILDAQEEMAELAGELSTVDFRIQSSARTRRHTDSLASNRKHSQTL